LVTILWLLALLSALVMAASTSFRGFAGMMSLDRQKVQLEGLWTAGLEVAAGMMSVLNEAPLLDVEGAIELASGTVRVRLEDEGGRIDVGKAPAEVLTSLFRSIGIPQPGAVAERLIEWRERKDLRATENAAVAPAAIEEVTAVMVPLTGLGQIAQVPGMRPEWVRAIAPLSTVFGDATVNPMTAPAAVLAALPGVEPSRLQMFIEMRGQASTVAAKNVRLLGGAERYLSIRTPRAASVYLRAKVAGGPAAAAHAVIVLLSGDSEPYRVLAWNPSPAFAGGLRSER
jgi:general secretion pathway protein K